MKMTLCVLVAAMALALAPAALATVSYDLVLQTNYQFGGCDSENPPVCGSPDTGYLTITNAGTSTFSGTFTLQNDGGGASLFEQLSVANFAPGDVLYLASGDEGSNQGGFGPNGLLFTALGAFNGSAVNLMVHDGDIHSGVFRTSPCDGISTDAFVLQGGSPTGCDNGDDFETTQTPGNYSFVQNGTTPEPGSFLLLGSGVLGAAGVIRRKLIG